MQKLRKITRETIYVFGVNVINKTKKESFGYDIPVELIAESLDDVTVDDVKKMLRDNVLCGLRLNLTIFLFVILCVAFGIFLHQFFFCS